MVNYWILGDFLTFALLLVAIFVWFRAALTLVNAYVCQLCYYFVSPHIDNNIRCEQQAVLLADNFMRARDKMIYRTMFSTAVILGIIAVRYVMGVVHAAV